ncbi:MAG: hypothetical protein GEV08_04380 [Acidimicrobiia bacterium]|nr:hypothetical protein [Acidimicrobiia bacterium]
MARPPAPRAHLPSSGTAGEYPAPLRSNPPGGNRARRRAPAYHRVMAEPGSYRDLFHRSGRAVSKLAQHQPEVHENFWKVHEAAMRPGALDRKTKELIGLALVVSMHCDVCITMHARDCLRAGCSREEVYEALNVAVMEGDGPTMVYAGWAVEAMEEYMDGRVAAPVPGPEEHAAHHH